MGPACGRQTELYNKFLAVAEGKLEAFLEEKGVTASDFYRRCREVCVAQLAARLPVRLALDVGPVLAGHGISGEGGCKLTRHVC